MHRLAVMVVLLLSACATPRQGQGDTPVSRGGVTAQRSCAACHAVAKGDGDSAAPRAVPFASLEMRHTVGLQGRLADLTRQGHYGMPPVALSAGELADLQAYIESLRPR